MPKKSLRSDRPERSAHTVTAERGASLAVGGMDLVIQRATVGSPASRFARRGADKRLLAKGGVRGDRLADVVAVVLCHGDKMRSRLRRVWPEFLRNKLA